MQLRLGGVFCPKIAYLEVLGETCSQWSIWSQQCLHSSSHFPPPSPLTSCAMEIWKDLFVTQILRVVDHLNVDCRQNRRCWSCRCITVGTCFPLLSYFEIIWIHNFHKITLDLYVVNSHLNIKRVKTQDRLQLFLHICASLQGLILDPLTFSNKTCLCHLAKGLFEAWHVIFGVKTGLGQH